MAITQLNTGGWPKGLARVVAVVNHTPRYFCTHYGIEFRRGCDGLDDRDEAVLTTEGGKTFALVRHGHDPAPGVEVMIFEHADPKSTFAEIMRGLNMAPSKCTWVHPDAIERASATA